MKPSMDPIAMYPRDALRAVDAVDALDAVDPFELQCVSSSDLFFLIYFFT